MAVQTGHDMVTRILCDSLKLRAYTVNSLETAKKIASIHNTTPNATVPLARTISAAGLLSATLKPESHQSITLRFNGNGPLREIHVQCDARGNIRGYVAVPDIDMIENMEHISFSKSIGAGFLTVIKDLNMKEPYSSHIPLLSGDVAKDITYYLTVSEQVPSALIIGLNLDRDGIITSSGGILIQTFPDTEPEVIEKIENNVSSLRKPLGDMLLEGDDLYSIISIIFDNNPIEIIDSYPLQAKCRCSKKIITEALKTISHDDITAMINEDKGAEITCTFCNKVYNFTIDELEAILSAKNKIINQNIFDTAP